MNDQKTKYTLTPEHEAMLPEWRDKWIANAMSTEPMDDSDREACIEAVHGLYDAAGLPRPLHIVFVPSPFVLRFAGGFAAAIWHRRGVEATREATDAATYEATREATDAATYEATREATDAATFGPTLAATSAATSAATYAATSAATDAATYAATRDATYDATYLATSDATDVATDVATFGATYAATSAATSAATDAATYAATRDATYDATWYTIPGFRQLRRWVSEQGEETFWWTCAQNAWRMWAGGNQWSGWAAFLSFFRHVADLNLPIYDKYQHWETLAQRSGPRIMHPKFCMISDRPEVLLVDDFNRPHCDDGPFCRWRDGSALYAIHGVRVPAWVVEDPDRITPEIIFKEENAEVRRVMMERYGVEKLFHHAEEVHSDIQMIGDGQAVPRAMYRFPDGSQWLYVTDGSTGRCYTLAALPTAKTCREAHEAMTGHDESTCLFRS